MLSVGDCLITFDSTHSALRAEMLLTTAGLGITVIPTPRAISASCGLAIAYRAADADRVAAVLREGGVRIDGRYRVTADARSRELGFERVSGAREDDGH